jgi:hypothetical protein
MKTIITAFLIISVLFAASLGLSGAAEPLPLTDAYCEQYCSRCHGSY